MYRHDPLYRIARQLHQHLLRPSPTTAAFVDRTSDLLTRQSTLGHLLRKFIIAHRRGWHLAAERLRSELPFNVRAVSVACEEVLAASSCQKHSPVRPQTIVDELRQLHAEFEIVDLSQRGRITARTDPIELEGITLGRFSIELPFDRLGHRSIDRLGSDCFDCIALDPNPASNSGEVTHPHVQGGRLCAGEGHTPIANALREGRICDAFCLVRSVLSTYNPDSPFVSLDGWDGISCGDCGYSTDRDQINSCEGCGNDLCEECISCCDVCGTSRCRECLDTDPVSEQRCCINCQRRCGQCRRMVDSDSFDADSGLCPQCLEERQAEAPALQESADDEDAPDTDPPVQPTPLTEEINHVSIPRPSAAGEGESSVKAASAAAA